jgi:polar amino acid transport system substrate-binding protein
MKKLVLAALATLAIGTAAVADPIKIGVAAEPYPPFTSPDASGTWVGWEIDFMHAICAQAKLDCVLTPTAWDGIIPALTSGQIDVIMSSMSITAEREKTIDFSDRYYKTPVAMIGVKGAVATPDEAGLAGKIMGLQISTSQEAYAQAHYAGAVGEMKTYQTQDEVNQDLASGRIDVMLIDALPGYDFLATDAGKACCELVGNVADDPELIGRGVGFGLRKGDPLKDTLNAAIKAVRADGTYDAITKKYFNFDIYGAAN